MNVRTYTRKDIGNLGERVAADYLSRHGFVIVDRNVSRKTGELDIIAREGETLHFVEVKTVLCTNFPDKSDAGRSESYNPASNLHAHKIRKVARTAEWYVAENEWEGDWQIDGVLVWIRESDAYAYVSYYPQIL